MRMHNLRRRIDSDAQVRAKKSVTDQINGIVSFITKMSKPRRERAFANGKIRRLCLKRAIHPSLITD